MKARAIRFHDNGGPEVLRWEEVDLPAPGEGEVLVRHSAIGLNYIDTYQRSGLYPMQLPSGLGLEAAGVVEQVGPGVTTHVAAGDRVAYGSGPPGGYSEARVMPAATVVKLPDSIDDRTAAAMMLKGMTVEYLLTRTYSVKAGETILFHAAAGGVGLIAGQWAKALGATVIGTAGSAEKCELARRHGYDHVIDYTKEDIAARVRELTNGAGVPVVYDSVGRATWIPSLDSLKPRGLLVSFGNASGPVTDVNLGILAQKGSLYVTRPTLMTYTATRPELEQSANAVMKMVSSGKVRIEVNQTYPLSEARKAHEDLEGRRTTGSTVLTV